MPCILHCSKGLQTIHCLPFQLVAWSTVKEWEKELCACSWPVKISSWKINTDAAAACYWLFLFAGANTVREQDFSGRVVAILLSLQNGGTRRDECHIARSKGEREKEMVSGGMLDAIFVLVEIEMTVIV